MPSALAAWLRLARTDRIGPVTFQQLVARFGSAEAALDAAPRLAARGGGKSFALPDAGLIAREIDAVARLGGRILMACEPDFPPGLAALDAPPPVITVLGHVPLLQRDMIAMVGARNASALGRSLAAQLARGLGEAGLVVASGLARGIDAAAHDAALATGTVAVVAGGVDVIYPPENEALYARIKAEGAVISEMPPGEMQSPTLALRMGQAALRTDGTVLDSELSPQTIARLDAWLAANRDGLQAMALTPESLQRFEPWFVGLLVSLADMTRRGLDPRLGLDEHFAEAAQQAGKQTAGFETGAQQIAYLDGMDKAEQQQFLAEALDESGQDDAELDALHDAGASLPEQQQERLHIGAQEQQQLRAEQGQEQVEHRRVQQRQHQAQLGMRHQGEHQQ